MTKMVSATEFKANCLKLITEMQRDGETITVTKRGKPVAEVKPPRGSGRSESLFGCMKGMVKIKGDIVGPIDPDWEAKWEAKWDELGFPAPAENP